ncbi:carbon-nitrogen hydrolase family protein [Bacteroidota bacterium]
MKQKSVITAIVQDSPVYLNLKQCMEKAEALISSASGDGAELIVFGETWLCGYPSWLDYCKDVNLWDHEPVKQVYALTHSNSITVPGPETDILGKLAKEYGLTIVIGINEKVTTGKGNGSLYNSLLTINDKGHIANHHRKLVPTYTEKLVWAQGDGHGLNAVETRFGRVGSLICWEHWMPQTRQAMHESGEHIHVAVWPWVNDVHQLASRHYAFEGRTFVIACGQIMRASDLPKQLDIRDELKSEPSGLILRGGSCIYAPDGSCLLEPQYDKDETILCEIENIEKTVQERMNLDVSGHYNRPDVFDLKINKNRN